MENDDVQVGQILSRREVVGLLGVGGAALLGVPGRLAGDDPGERPAGAPFRLPACIVRPSQTEGPYFLDAVLERSDIRPDPSDGSVPEGTPLSLAFRVSRIGADGCRPLAGAVVDAWQCDAGGVYSGVRDINGLFDTTGKQFLRGHQVTGPDGMARFTTIYPGWYEGRTVHVHFKIRTDPEAERGHEFTSQLYFDDAVSDRVFANPPYTGREGRRRRNREDGIYGSAGDQLLLEVEEADAGLSGVFDVGLQIE